jgi:nucleoside-diphosphate-sugar epimerase
MSVAIVGAGFVGLALARALRPTHDVILCSRSGQPRQPPAPAPMVALDVTAPDLDPRAIASADALVLAYAPGRGGDREALYVDGTRRLLQRLRAPLRRLVWLGSTSAFPDEDAWLDERCERWPASERGQVQRRAEAVVFEHADRTGTPTFALRLAGLHGPGRELDRVYRPRGEAAAAARPGHGWEPTNLVHRDDVVAAVCAALAAPAHLTGVVAVCDDDHTPRRRMYERIAGAQGADPVSWQQPIPADGVPVGKRVSNERLKAWLGVRLAHPTHAHG